MARTASSSAGEPAAIDTGSRPIAARAPVADRVVRLVREQVAGHHQQRGGLERVGSAHRVERVLHVVGAAREGHTGVEQGPQARSGRVASPSRGRGPAGRGWSGAASRRRCRLRRPRPRPPSARIPPACRGSRSGSRSRRGGSPCCDTSRAKSRSPSTSGSRVSSVWRSIGRPAAAAASKHASRQPRRSSSRCGQPPVTSTPMVERLAQQRAVVRARRARGRKRDQRHDLDVDEVAQLLADLDERLHAAQPDHAAQVAVRADRGVARSRRRRAPARRGAVDDVVLREGRPGGVPRLDRAEQVSGAVDHPIRGQRLVEVRMGFGRRREQHVSGEVVHLVVGEPLERADGGDAIASHAHVDRPALCGCRPNQEDAPLRRDGSAATARSRDPIGALGSAAPSEVTVARRRSGGRGRSRGRTAAAVATSCPRAVSPSAHAGGRVPFEGDRGARGVRPDREARGLLLGRSGGTVPRRSLGTGDSPSPNVRARTCKRICGCESPPIVPSTAARRPSRSVTSAGVSVCGGCRPGAYSAGCPSSTEKPMPAVVQVDARRRLEQVAAEPRGVRLDERHADAVPVDDAQRGRVADSLRRHRDGEAWSTVDGRASRREARGARRARGPSAASCSTVGPVVARLLRRLDRADAPRADRRRRQARARPSAIQALARST